MTEQPCSIPVPLLLVEKSYLDTKVCTRYLGTAVCVMSDCHVCCMVAQFIINSTSTAVQLYVYMHVIL